MRNKKVIITVIILVVVLVILATVFILDKKKSNMAVISGNTSGKRQSIIMGMLEYDSNIKCDTNIEVDKNVIVLIFTAKDNYTKSKYGETVVEVKLDKNNYELKEIDTNFVELKDSIQKQLSNN